MRFYVMIENELGDVQIHAETDSEEIGRIIAESLSLRFWRSLWALVDVHGVKLVEFRGGSEADSRADGRSVQV